MQLNCIGLFRVQILSLMHPVCVLLFEQARLYMKCRIKVLVLLLSSLCAACNRQKPVISQRILVGEWQVIESKSQNPNLLIYPLSDGGLFACDDLSGRWRSYSAWLSKDHTALLGRQGCTKQYSFRLSYLQKHDRLVVNDTVVLEHSKLIPRQLQQ